MHLPPELSFEMLFTSNLYIISLGITLILTTLTIVIILANQTWSTTFKAGLTSCLTGIIETNEKKGLRLNGKEM